MGNALTQISSAAKSAFRIIRAAGPLLIAHSDRLSDAYAKHQLKLATVEAIKEGMIADAKGFSELRTRCLDKYLTAQPDERLRLRQDIEQLDRESRQLNIYQRAIELLPAPHRDSTEKPQAQDADSVDMPASWLDSFNDFARKRNAPWRAELLAKALAMEAQNHGSIGTRALWFIGTMDETAFHAFAAVLDIAIKLGDTYVVPNVSGYLNKSISTCALGSDIQLATILFDLGDLGLFGDIQTSCKVLEAPLQFHASYGSRSFTASLTRTLEIKGILLTNLGDVVARLYEPKEDALGTEIFESWVARTRILPNIENVETTGF